MPGRPATPPQQPGGQTAESSVTGAIRSFRPPAGFLDAALRGEDVSNFQEDEDMEAMLNRLKSQAGAWHDLAKLLPALARSGMDSAAVEEATGLERAYQNTWIVSASVYDSLKQSPEVPDEVVDYFGSEGGEYLLYELRFLSVQQRVAPAVYIAENQLDQRESNILARAVKEHQRRLGDKMGFSAAPGDCLAFKYYRDALECKKEQERARQQCVEKGLKVAVTDSARAVLAKVVATEAEEPATFDSSGAPVVKAQLDMVRFTQEELGVRPVAVAGELGSATLSDASEAPVASLRGAFGAFTTAAASSTEWVALPAWNIILLAKSPVAVYIPDCSKVPAIAAATSATTDEAKAKLVGPALLVCERGTEVVPEKYLLVSDATGGSLQLAPAEALPADAIVAGSVLFCCRPPQLNFGASAQTSELLQL